MNEFKRVILMTQVFESTPPSPYAHTVKSGSYACTGGYVGISGGSNIIVYSNKLIVDLVIGDTLYSDIGLTTPTTATYIQTQTGGDLFITMSVPGVIDTIESPGSAC